jgi:hypothetical protein
MTAKDRGREVCERRRIGLSEGEDDHGIIFAFFSLLSPNKAA